MIRRGLAREEVNGPRETVAALVWQTPISRDALVRSCHALLQAVQAVQAVQAALVELALAGRAYFCPKAS
jgi:hypothetical protein